MLCNFRLADPVVPYLSHLLCVLPPFCNLARDGYAGQRVGEATRPQQRFARQRSSFGSRPPFSHPSSRGRGRKLRTGQSGLRHRRTQPAQSSRLFGCASALTSAAESTSTVSFSVSARTGGSRVPHLRTVRPRPCSSHPQNDHGTHYAHAAQALKKEAAPSARKHCAAQGSPRGGVHNLQGHQVTQNSPVYGLSQGYHDQGPGGRERLSGPPSHDPSGARPKRKPTSSTAPSQFPARVRRSTTVRGPIARSVMSLCQTGKHDFFPNCAGPQRWLSSVA